MPREKSSPNRGARPASATSAPPAGRRPMSAASSGSTDATFSLPLVGRVAPKGSGGGKPQAQCALPPHPALPTRGREKEHERASGATRTVLLVRREERCRGKGE